MMGKDQEPVEADIVCALVKNLPNNPIKNSSQIPCDTCGRACWISPASLKLHKKHPEYKIICGECAEKWYKKHPNFDASMTPEQFEETRKHLGREPDIDNVAKILRGEKRRRG